MGNPDDDVTPAPDDVTPAPDDVTPAPAVVAVVAADDEGDDGEQAFYRVQPTDRWESIASEFGLDVTDLLALNADRPHHSDRGVPVNQFVRVK